MLDLKKKNSQTHSAWSSKKTLMVLKGLCVPACENQGFVANDSFEVKADRVKRLNLWSFIKVL